MPDQDYEFVEVKVSHKIDIKLSLDDLIAMVNQEVASLTASGQQVSADVADKVRLLSQLATDVKGSLGPRA